MYGRLFCELQSDLVFIHPPFKILSALLPWLLRMWACLLKVVVVLKKKCTLDIVCQMGR